MSDLAILGAGAFGSALAAALQGPVTLWGRRPPAPLPGVVTTTDLAQALAARTVLLAIPAQALGQFLAEHGPALDGRTLVSCAKGIDLATLTGPSRLIAQACPAATVAVLTGPSFAADIGRGLPTALTLACADPATGEALQHRLSTPVLRLYRTEDVTGAELGGALKNVIAIAAGAAIGAGMGDSARAAVITRGFAEMTRLATRLDGLPETLAGLSGLGDLILTATSPQSRNFRFGETIGRGETFDPSITVEGAATAQAVVALAAKLHIDMPVAEQVAALANGTTTVHAAMDALLSRPLKPEQEFRRCPSMP